MCGASPSSACLATSIPIGCLAAKGAGSPVRTDALLTHETPVPTRLPGAPSSIHSSIPAASYTRGHDGACESRLGATSRPPVSGSCIELPAAATHAILAGENPSLTGGEALPVPARPPEAQVHPSSVAHLQGIKKQPQFVAKIRELSTKVHHRCQNDDDLPAR